MDNPAIDINNQSVRVAPGPFLFGSSMQCIEDWVLEADRAKHLSIGNLLADTPPNWVDLGGFRIGRSMVTNGEYQEFLNYKVGDEYFYDNREFWDHVWDGLNLRIDRVTTAIVNWDGDIIKTEENYTAAGNFVEAYIDSLKYEVDNLFPQLRQETEKCFKYVKYRLAEYFDRSSAPDRRSTISLAIDEERISIDDFKADPVLALQSIGTYLKTLYAGYGKNVRPDRASVFRKGEFPIETVAFLRRFCLELDALAPGGRPALRNILYPRYWGYPAATGRKKGTTGILDFKTGVPWTDRPVTGVSLYEAAAYTVWLSKVAGQAICLPTEAEFEKAATWPVTPPMEGAPLDPRHKTTFPWQAEKDFHYFFGRAGKEVDAYYHANEKEWKKLVKATARDCGAEGAINMLIGFGWQWTRERYDPNERRYSRFGLAHYSEYRELKCRADGDGAQGKARVYGYIPVDNRSFSFFVARGCPDVIGGPGLVTRRYAFYPLRGYPNIGFRYVAQEEE